VTRPVSHGCPASLMVTFNKHLPIAISIPSKLQLHHCQRNSGFISLGGVPRQQHKYGGDPVAHDIDRTVHIYGTSIYYLWIGSGTAYFSLPLSIRTNGNQNHRLHASRSDVSPREKMLSTRACVVGMEKFRRQDDDSCETLDRMG
jgi:hypothetical protein